MKFSVCIPTVNRIEFLRDALESVREQSNVDLEVVISENSGKPTYGEAVRRLVGEFADLSIRVHHHPKQISLTENANFLIDFADGDAVVHLPDDDMLCPNFLRLALDVFMKNPHLDFVFGDHWLMNVDGSIDVRGSDRATHFFRRDMLREGEVSGDELYFVAVHQSLCLQTMVCRKTTMQRFRFSLDAGPVPDFDLGVRLATAKPTPRAYFIASRLVKYRQHGDQWTHNQEGTRGLEAMIESLESSEVPRLVRAARDRKLSELYLSLALSEANKGERAPALRHTIRALRLCPSVRGLATVPIAVGGGTRWGRALHDHALSIRRWMRS